MAVSFTRLSWWLWGSKEKGAVVSNSSPLNSSSERRRETVKFRSTKGAKIAPPCHRKVKRKWQSREERRMDEEHDVVFVPSDGGGCLSGFESDDSDWSIGWLEPHGSDFQSDDESDNSFAVLVPCYRPGCKEVEGSNNDLLTVIKNLPNELSPGGFMFHWFSITALLFYITICSFQLSCFFKSKLRKSCLLPINDSMPFALILVLGISEVKTFYL